MPHSTSLHVKTEQPLIRLAMCLLLLLLPLAKAVAASEMAPGASSPMPVPLAETESVPVFTGDWVGKVVAIPVKGAIAGKPFSTMPDMVNAALDKADADGAHLVVLEIDSPGGVVNVCDEMAKRIFDAKTPVVSLVLHKAVSGAAMIASAAREIVMTRTARIGDIQPMQMSLTGSGGAMDDRTAEKIEVDIRTIMKVYAHQHHRPAAVMEAMVSRSSSLYQVTFHNAPAEYLTGHELELLEKNVDLGRDARRIADTKIIKPDGKLLELSAPQAVEYGVASEMVDSADAFYASRGITQDEIVRPEVPVGELDLKKLIPSVSDLGLPLWVVVLLGVFLVVGVAGLVTEYHAPGSGIPAAIGIIGFACFFATLLMHDRGSPLGIAMFLLGIILLVVEIMVIPGFGVAGVLGILGVLGGLLLAFTPDWNSEYMSQFMWQEVGAFTLLIFLGMVAAVAVIILISKFGEDLPYIGRFFLSESQPGGHNPYPELLRDEPRESARIRLQLLTGRTGVAETTLRPAGKVRLDSGELLDVVTDGVYIEEGTNVVVREAAPNRIVVAVQRPSA
ncbi:MAG: ATP-dependent Clp protease proteolytic subunit [Planctomycetaceae bacterium]|nr:ATP-dependent Clp protease proteolytic subunit [Planctomycetaceae bacterium]